VNNLGLMTRAEQLHLLEFIGNIKAYRRGHFVIAAQMVTNQLV
jgi:hypothetical protein